MTYLQFKSYCDELKRFNAEQDKLNDVIKVIAPTSTGVVEFGSHFIDAYIRLVDEAMNTDDMFAWFVFENDWGKKKLFIKDLRENGKEYIIKSERDFYNWAMKGAKK